MMPLSQHLWRHLLALTGCMILCSCSSTGYSMTSLAEEINATLSSSSREVKVGDIITVSFPFQSEWDHVAQVMEDGTASFSLVGELRVLGMSMQRLNDELTKAYDRARNGQRVDLNASITATGDGEVDANNSLFVIGEVRTPGPIRVNGKRITLVEAISAAGGHLKLTANLGNTILVRRIRGSNEMRSWRLDADVYEWGEHPPIYLQERDVVFVPNTAIDDVNIFVDQWIRQMLPFPIFPISPTTP
ncbi:MAG: hypothetical protein CMJ88_03530 [Planctomycetes bacterium]|nr:hypothetical protein [Planctomycetota bacterium]